MLSGYSSVSFKFIRSVHNFLKLKLCRDCIVTLKVYIIKLILKNMILRLEMQQSISQKSESDLFSIHQL